MLKKLKKKKPSKLDKKIDKLLDKQKDIDSTIGYLSDFLGGFNCIEDSKVCNNIESNSKESK